MEWYVVVVVVVRACAVGVPLGDAQVDFDVVDSTGDWEAPPVDAIGRCVVRVDGRRVDDSIVLDHRGTVCELDVVVRCDVEIRRIDVPDDADRVVPLVATVGERDVRFVEDEKG